MLLHRTIVSCLLAGLPTASALAQEAPPATAPAQPRRQGYAGAITADNVFVRSGPSVQSSYPFGRLMLGDLVQVEEETGGWAKVRTSGPAFRNAFGYVLANDAVNLSADGSTLTVVKAAEVRAPNLDADANPDSSFKVIGTLPAGAGVRVLGQVSGDREKVHRIALPDTSIGWININYIRRASASEAAAGTASGAPAAAAAEATPTVGDGTVTTQTPPAGEAAAPKEPAPPPAPAPKTPVQLAAEKRQADLKALEASWAKLRDEPQETAEISELKSRYQALASDPAAEKSIKEICTTRVKQLELRAEIQKSMQAARAAQAGVGKDDERLKALRIAMEARADYTAVGILNASTVYDGNRLPLLFRLTDPASGQTVAYVAVKDANLLSTMLGTLVGIRGSQRFDEALKVNIVDPGTIDLLTIRKEAQVTPESK